MNRAFTLLFYGCGCLALLALAGCSATRKVPEGEFLYVGHKIDITVKREMPDRKAAKEELDDVVTPKPVSSFLGMRPRLWLWQRISEPKKPRGFKHWLKNKVGEKPTYISQIKPEKVTNLMRNRLYNRGYFEVETGHRQELKEKKKTGRMVYLARVDRPYRIDSIIWVKVTDTTLTKDLAGMQRRSLLKPGQQYNVTNFSEERARLDEQLKHRGYYYFDQDFLAFEVDSSLRNGKVNVYLKVKDGVPENGLKRWRIHDVHLNPLYVLSRDSIVMETDTLRRSGLIFQNYTWDVRPGVYIRSVYLKHGGIYDSRNHDRTISRLQGLNLYKYVGVQFVPAADSANMHWLDTYINLSPMRKKTLSAEVLMSTKSNNFTGPGLRASWRNRNIFHGAEMLQFSLNAGYESIISGQLKGLNSWELGGEVSLTVPHFILPFKVKHNSRDFMPYTRFKTGYSILNRVFFYQLNSITFDAGYAWRETKRIDHSFYPISINFVDLRRVYPEFENLLQRNAFLRRSFEQQLILGSNYNFVYSDQASRKLRNHWYFSGLADWSGNLAYLASRTIGREFDAEKPYEIAGIPFAQYAKLETDTRYYWHISKQTMLANRFIAGVGVPYGNARQLPFIKQFFIGGNNSIRAFQIRSIGPGSYRSPDSLRRTFFFDQTGDIKLEANTEYRFPIISVLKGALFLDVGNVWLLRATPERPGGEFSRNFLGQLAVGSGFGLRVDVTFFVFRLDLGVPLRKPYLEPGERWTVGKISPGSRDWRRDNLVLNIAIGYPF